MLHTAALALIAVGIATAVLLKDRAVPSHDHNWSTHAWMGLMCWLISIGQVRACAVYLRILFDHIAHAHFALAEAMWVAEEQNPFTRFPGGPAELLPPFSLQAQFFYGLYVYMLSSWTVEQRKEHTKVCAQRAAPFPAVLPRRRGTACYVYVSRRIALLPTVLLRRLQLHSLRRMGARLWGPAARAVSLVTI